jgi:hypothetical protein
MGTVGLPAEPRRKAHMAMLRTKCLSTKLTDEEYATLEEMAGEETLSAWARAVLLRAAAPTPIESAILAELLALRTILLNLHFAAVSGDTPTMDAMQRLIDRADRDKLGKAQERLTLAAGQGSR